MPYELQKKNNKAYVVTSDTGKKHSKKPLPMSTALRQLAALNIVLAKGGK
jgi:hypothetical protein